MTSLSRDKITSCICGFMHFKKAKLLPFDHLPFLLFSRWVVFLGGSRPVPKHLQVDVGPPPFNDLGRADQNTRQNSAQVLQDLHCIFPHPPSLIFFLVAKLGVNLVII